MRFSYKLTVRECIAGGAGRALEFLLYRSRIFRTSMLILGGAAILGSVLTSIRDGNVYFIPVIVTVCVLALMSIFIWMVLIPAEAAKIYRQCGRREREVWIEDGSIFVKNGGTTREFLCRGIREFRKQGRLYRIAMTWRLGMPVDLYLPVRLVGGREEQEAFRRYISDQRRISGDKLVQAGGCEPETWPAGEDCICQTWSMDTVTAAMAESHWIGTHYMKQAGRGARISRDILLAGAAVLSLGFLMVTAQFTAGGFGWTLLAAAMAVMAVRLMRGRRPGLISQRSLREALHRNGIDSYDGSEKLYFTPQGIRRVAPLLENTWEWSQIGYLFESDGFLYFYSPEQELMLYMEKDLIGDWMALKLFVQDCQARGIAYQLVHPEYIRDVQCPAGAGAPWAGNEVQGKAGVSSAGNAVQGKTGAPLAGREVPGKNGLHVLDGGKAAKKKGARPEEPDKSISRIPDTQEGWRKFWAEKEKEQGASDRRQFMVGLLVVAGIFLLAVFLPEFHGSPDLGGFPVMMDMPENGEPYVFHPESYKNYVPLERQVTVLESLGFTMPEGAVEELERSLEEMPEGRVWVEGYPYTSLLTMIGMPEWDYEAWEVTKYPTQAYWFDWEGFDMSMEYVHILNGVNAMAGGDFVITDAQQEMSEADWEKGTGTVHVRFRIDGELYGFKMKLMNDWLDTNVIREINKALKDAGIEKRVYGMEDGGQGCILIYRDGEWAKRFQRETGIKLQDR